MDAVDDIVAQPGVDDMVADPGASKWPAGESAPGAAAPMRPTILSKLVMHALNALATLPKRAIQNSQYSLDTGNYDPSVPLEAASTAMTGGIGGVPARGAEAVLGSGPPRRLQSDVMDQFKTGAKVATGADLEAAIAARQAGLQAAISARKGAPAAEFDMTARRRPPAPAAAPAGGERLDSAVMRQFRASQEAPSLEGAKLIPVDHDPFKGVP